MQLQIEKQGKALVMMIEKQNMEFGKPEEAEAEADSRRSKRPRKGWMKTRFLGMIDDNDDDETENGVFGEACRVLTY